MTTRFDLPSAGAPTSLRFPHIDRDVLGNDLAVWTIPQATVPLVTIALVVGYGTAEDPDAQHGLGSLTADLLDEGAGTLDAIALSDALARMGTEIAIDAGADQTTISLTTLSRFLAPSMALLADVVTRPHFDAEGLARVRDLRLNRLRQLSESASAVADRAFVNAVFDRHPYGHGALGTTAALRAIGLEEVRACWSRLAGPRSATLIVAGDATSAQAMAAAREAFGSWRGTALAPPSTPIPAPPPDPRVRLVHRPGAAQSELRIGHAAPPRRTSGYHAAVTLNAIVGGQFTSRINRNLREEKGVTYGARTTFDLRRAAGTFSCDTSVQIDATALAVREVLRELDEVRQAGAISDDEVERAKASLTRGYVRNFETAGHLARAAAQLVVHGLDDNEFDRFVPEVDRVTARDVSAIAREWIRPDDAVVVVVGDADRSREALTELGRPVVELLPEF